MPGFFPGRPGGEHGEPLLDMILERRPIPPGAPPEIHGLAYMLAAAAGPAEPGELTGQAAALAAFTRLVSPVGISLAVPRSARRSMPEWRARGRLPLAAALTAVAAGLGSTAAAYAGVLPGPIQHFAHNVLGAPAPQHDAFGHGPAVAGSPTHTSASLGPAVSYQKGSSVPDRGHGRSQDRHDNWQGDGNNCQPAQAKDQDQNQNQNQSRPSPVRDTPGSGQNPGQDQAQNPSKANPGQKPTRGPCPAVSPGR